MDRLAHWAGKTKRLATLHRATPRAADAADDARVSLVTSLAGLHALAADWQALEADAQDNPTVFQSFAWVSTWCNIYCSGANAPGIHVITGYDDNRLVFVWPLMLTRRAGCQVLCWLTEPFGQYGDVLVANGENATRWINSAISLLRRLKGIDILRLRHVRDDSTLARRGGEHLVSAHFNERAPYLDLSQFATEEDYENRYTGTQRKRRKKIRKHLEEMGGISFTRLPLGTLTDKAMAAAMAEKNNWLAERGRINRIMGCPYHWEFLKALSRTRQGKFEMVVSELKAGDTAVSWEISFRFGSTHFAYITSHVNALTDLSPGRLHFDMSQRACLRDGLKTFDLMVPYDPHKESWSSGCMGAQDYYLPLSLKGAALGTIYLGHVRPWLRAAYYRMPQSLLRLLNPKRTSGND